MQYSKLVVGSLFAATVIAACGGGSSGGGNTTVTSPTTTQLTVADAAPSIGEELAITINTALRAGTASSPQPSTLAAIWRFFVPTLTAQTAPSNFVANCNRGGNINIRYTGFRPVVLANTPIEVSNCGMRGRDASFSGTLTSNGHWTATAPGPVAVSGNVTSPTITAGTPIAIDAAVTNTTFNGRVGGVTVGALDTNPPPNPNSCPATLSQAAITIPQAGGSFSVAITVGSTCAWSVTSAPTWLSFTNAGGRGNGSITFTVSASDGNQRTGSITVNNMSISLNQLATTSTTPPTTPPTTPTTGTQSDGLGQWTGTIIASNPCSVGMPNGTYTWRATVTRKGAAYNMSFYDSYFNETRDLDLPVLGPSREFRFTAQDGFDTIILDGQFLPDWQSLTGTVSGTIDCLTSRRPTTGSWNGRRIGP